MCCARCSASALKASGERRVRMRQRVRPGTNGSRTNPRSSLVWHREGPAPMDACSRETYREHAVRRPAAQTVSLLFGRGKADGRAQPSPSSCSYETASLPLIPCTGAAEHSPRKTMMVFKHMCLRMSSDQVFDDSDSSSCCPTRYVALPVGGSNLPRATCTAGAVRIRSGYRAGWSARWRE